MHAPQVDQCVRLKHSIPELALPDGAVGVVCSTWFAPQTAYEVEFKTAGLPPDATLRVLVLESQLESIPEPVAMVA